MEGLTSLDPIGQGILHILSRYESLDFLELWYEIGEDDGLKGQVSKEALLNRLESLAARGYVERVVSQGTKSGSAPLIYRIRTRGDATQDGQGGPGET